MARISDLEHRLRAMLKPNRNRRPAGRLMFITAALAALALLAPLAAIPTPALAAEGSVTGVVRDVSGALVPQARITVAFLGSSRKEITTTDQVGQFSLGPLPDGEYAVTVSKPGFAALSVQNVALENGIARRLELVLQVGKVQESMTVTAESLNPPQLAQGANEPKRIRVGGDVQATKLVKLPRPVYPAACKAEHIEGTVLLRAVVSKEGDVLSLEPINKLVDARLVEASIEVVKQWKYQPTLLNGEPVEVVTNIEVNYRLTQ